MNDETRKLLEDIAEQDLNEYRKENPKMSEGQIALEAIHIYEACFLQPPPEVIETISRCWRKYKEGIDLKSFCLDPDGYPSWFGGPRVDGEIIETAEDGILRRRWHVKEGQNEKTKERLHLPIKHYKTLDEAFGVTRLKPIKRTAGLRNQKLAWAIYSRLVKLYVDGHVITKDDDGYESSLKSAYKIIVDELKQKYGIEMKPSNVHHIRKEYENATGADLFVDVEKKRRK